MCLWLRSRSTYIPKSHFGTGTHLAFPFHFLHRLLGFFFIPAEGNIINVEKDESSLQHDARLRLLRDFFEP
jgi:hypothetical protein